MNSHPKALSTLGSYRGKGDDKATAFRKMPTGGERPPKRGTKLHFMVIFTFAPATPIQAINELRNQEMAKIH